MKKIIGILANDEALKNRIIECFRSHYQRGEILIEVFKSGEEENQTKKLVNNGAKVLVSRSGLYDVVSSYVEIPILRLNITTEDILFALKQAEQFNKKIVFIQRDHLDFSLEEWKGIISFSQEIIIKKFHNPEEVEPIIKKYDGQQSDIIFVGGGMCSLIAPRYNFKTVFLNARKASIRNTINHCFELLNKMEEEILRSQIAEKMLFNIHDAVIAINNQKKIILFNHTAEKILNNSLNNVLNRPLEKALPELSFILNIYDKNIEYKDEIRLLNNGKIITINTSFIEIDGQKKAMLCSFQDITNLQMLERKIRFQLSKKGLIAKLTFNDIIHVDPKMTSLINEAKKIAQSDSTVLITGESGTGKEIFAQSIHNASKRKSFPFVVINCATINPPLLESELFGYEGGSFTGARKEGKRGLFELAHQGTIFLDEINSIPADLQVKLLRVIEEKEIMRIGSDYVIPLNVRIIAASNENLREKTLAGKFRSDLFFRLSVLEINLIPLRQRKKDIIPLFKLFLKEKSISDLSEQMMNDLLAYDWPGNVRELKNVANKFDILGKIELKQSINLNQNKKISSINLKELNSIIESGIIELLLEKGHSKTEVAKILGITRTGLWKKIKKQSKD